MQFESGYVDFLGIQRELNPKRITEITKYVNTIWPAPGSEDTELGVLMEPEVGHGETEIYAGVQA
jgi:hypothetical protein